MEIEGTLVIFRTRSCGEKPSDKADSNETHHVGRRSKAEIIALGFVMGRQHEDLPGVGEV